MNTFNICKTCEKEEDIICIDDKCQEDKFIICYKCLYKKHKNHNYKLIDDFYEDFFKTK
jgi:hypothetical protein